MGYIARYTLCARPDGIVHEIQTYVCTYQVILTTSGQAPCCLERRVGVSMFDVVNGRNTTTAMSSCTSTASQQSQQFALTSSYSLMARAHWPALNCSLPRSLASRAFSGSTYLACHGMETDQVQIRFTPTRHNACSASEAICYKSGSNQRKPSKPSPTK